MFITKIIETYQRKWLQHLEIMFDANRLPTLRYQYEPKGRRRRGRAIQGWQDQFYSLQPEETNQ